MDENDPVVARPRRRNRLPRQAALIGATIPLIALLASLVLRVSSGKIDWAEVARTGVYPVGLVETAACAMGVIFALIALCAIPAQGTKGLLFPGVGGLVMSSGLLVLSFLQLKQQETLARQAHAIEATEEELQHAMLDRYEAKRAPAYVLDDVAAFVNEIDTATEISAEQRATITQRSTDLNQQITERADRYEAEIRAFTEARVLNVASITNQADIVARKQVTQKFLDSAIDLRDYVANVEASVGKLFAELKLDEESREQFISVFLRTSKVDRETLARIREQDVRVATATRDLLQMLETNWGKWVHDPVDKVTEFDNKELAEQFNKLTEEIHSMAVESLHLQDLISP